MGRRWREMRRKRSVVWQFGRRGVSRDEGEKERDVRRHMEE